MPNHSQRSSNILVHNEFELGGVLSVKRGNKLGLNHFKELFTLITDHITDSNGYKVIQKM